uniref:Uncharacterized protein n=1 Tax=Timema genevievae TaxID=629358 RepID=A0A7R9PS32_TIMGE|nr:unnamed protein product [Timema genevievae]
MRQEQLQGTNKFLDIHTSTLKLSMNSFVPIYTRLSHWPAHST